MLNTIEDLLDLDLGADLDSPNTWEEAKNLPDKQRWEESYHEELNSLKEMGV